MATGSVEAPSSAEQLCSAGQPAHKKLKMAMGSVDASSTVEIFESQARGFKHDHRSPELSKALSKTGRYQAKVTKPKSLS